MTFYCVYFENIKMLISLCSDLHTKIFWRWFFVWQKCRNYGLVTIILSYEKYCQRKICPMKFRLISKSIRGWAIIRCVQPWQVISYKSISPDWYYLGEAENKLMICSHHKMLITCTTKCLFMFCVFISTTNVNDK